MIEEVIMEALAFWMYFVGPELAEADENHGVLSADQVRRIGSQFSVARTVPGFAGEAIAQQLTDQINGLAAAVANQALIARARATEQAAIDFSAAFDLDRTPRSGFSKWSWFANPKDWVMFDGLSWSAVGGANMIDFYSRLDNAGLIGTLADLRPILRQYRQDERLAERILDTTLLAQGGMPLRPARFSRVPVSPEMVAQIAEVVRPFIDRVALQRYHQCSETPSHER